MEGMDEQTSVKGCYYFTTLILIGCWLPEHK